MAQFEEIWRHIQLKCAAKVIHAKGKGVSKAVGTLTYMQQRTNSLILCLHALKIAIHSGEGDAGSEIEGEDKIEEDLAALIAESMSYLDMADEDCTTALPDSTCDTPDRVHMALATPE